MRLLRSVSVRLTPSPDGPAPGCTAAYVYGSARSPHSLPGINGGGGHVSVARRGGGDKTSDIVSEFPLLNELLQPRWREITRMLTPDPHDPLFSAVLICQRWHPLIGTHPELRPDHPTSFLFATAPAYTSPPPPPSPLLLSLSPAAASQRAAPLVWCPSIISDRWCANLFSS